MKAKDFVGKTLGELAKETSVFWRPLHVFLLEDENDTVGKRLMDAYAIRQVVSAVPAAAEATVIIADDYFGEPVLRVRVV